MELFRHALNPETVRRASSLETGGSSSFVISSDGMLLISPSLVTTSMPAIDVAVDQSLSAGIFS
jgi:hypothetical protein